MSILMVGSVAMDSVETPFGKAEAVLGGSAIYSSVSASYFTEVQLVAVVGTDFPEEHLALLADRQIDLGGLERAPGQTFRWAGRYGFDLSEPETLETRLNVFEQFRPKVPEPSRDAEFVFLANIDPELQLTVLRQMRHPRLVACDTMNFWIERKREGLERVLEKVDVVIINEAEARQLSGEPNLVRAARRILGAGPDTLVIKRGEYGALMFSNDSIFSAPGYPLESIFDPTGAGDAFAGGFLGYLANTRDLTDEGLRRAVIFGSVMASFTVEDFSLNRLRQLTYPEIEARYKEFKRLAHFEDI
ncbi:MAG: sugar kinase [Deltaproteobacteria bacterium]|nr:sugar kinase [Deltaproteobacteria bacterium]MBI3076734.1 sugar kinase [Deltaproteobacteria bacterium]